MVEDNAPRRFGRAKSGDRFPNHRERTTRACQAAEALLAPKPRSAEPPNSKRLVDTVRVSETAATAPVPAVVDTEQPGSAAIPAAHSPRIRTWMRYGMTAREVAKVYGVPLSEIERVLREG